MLARGAEPRDGILGVDPNGVRPLKGRCRRGWQPCPRHLVGPGHKHVLRTCLDTLIHLISSPQGLEVSGINIPLLQLGKESDTGRWEKRQSWNQNLTQAPLQPAPHSLKTHAPPPHTRGCTWGRETRHGPTLRSPIWQLLQHCRQNRG